MVFVCLFPNKMLHFWSSYLKNSVLYLITHPSRPRRSSPGPVWSPVGGTPEESPRHLSPVPGSEASPWGTPWSACGRARRRALWLNTRDQDAALQPRADARRERSQGFKSCSQLIWWGWISTPAPKLLKNKWARVAFNTVKPPREGGEMKWDHRF